MAPNTSENLDPTLVTDFEADAPIFEKAQTGNLKKPRMVKVSTFSLDGEVPEKGSWHYNRKKAILAKHPEIKNLYGHNPWSFVLMMFAFISQVVIGIILAESSWLTILFVSYTLGAYLNWILAMMAHEGSHGLVFENRSLNKVHSILAFLPCFVGPFGSYWVLDHMYHHQVIVDKMNRYGPQSNSFLKKLLFTFFFANVSNVFFLFSSTVVLLRVIYHRLLHFLNLVETPYPAGYKLKPFQSFPQAANSRWFFLNCTLALIFNWYLLQHGMVPIVYLFLSNGWCNGLHPLGMRQVQEHYMQRKGQPTNSLYSPFSFFLCHSGYHVEHHDFPSIPWNRLPFVKKAAPEFYDSLFYYESYAEVWFEFFNNPGIPYTALIDEAD